MADARTTNLLGAFLTGLHAQMNERIVQESAISADGAAALVAIAYNEGRTVEFLRKTLSLSHSWTVRVVEKLQSVGLINKKTGSDKRAVALFVTEQGKRKVQGIVRARRRCLDEVLGVLPVKDQKQFTGMLERMLAFMPDGVGFRRSHLQAVRGRRVPAESLPGDPGGGCQGITPRVVRPQRRALLTQQVQVVIPAIAIARRQACSCGEISCSLNATPGKSVADPGSTGRHISDCLLAMENAASATFDAWALAHAAARAIGTFDAEFPGPFAFVANGGLERVATGDPAAVLQWSPSTGWESVLAAADPQRDLLDLYLPISSGTAGRPVTIGHLGQSLDGFIATHSGDAISVTGPENILHLHRLRALCDAVIVGAGTVMADNPRLTTRLVAGSNPVRVILDPGGRLPAAHTVFNDGAALTLRVCAAGSSAAAEARARGEDLLEVAACEGALDLTDLLRQLRAPGLLPDFCGRWGRYGVLVSQCRAAGSAAHRHRATDHRGRPPGNSPAAPGAPAGLSATPASCLSRRQRHPV